jgi:hypothetical protein
VTRSALRLKLCGLLICLCALAVGCGSDGDEPEPASAGTSASTTQPLVGRWERVNECPQLVKAFEEAGLAKLAPAYVGDYFPDTKPSELAKKTDLCQAAKPFVHSHFFSESGAFGSLTADLEQVDDGTYEITGDGTFVVSKEFPDVTFKYTIDGDRLTLTPVLTPPLKKAALAKPLDFTAGGWAITMAYPGQEWKRVACNGWC